MKGFETFISQITEELKGFCQSLPLQEATFEEIEENHRNFMMKLGREILQFNLDQLAGEKRGGYQGTVKEVGGRVAIFERYERRGINTYFGEVSLKRAYYWFPEVGEPEGFFPLDEELKLGRRKCSPSLEKGLALVGIEAPFAKASRLFKELTLVEVSAKTIEEITQNKGEEVRKQKWEKAERAWEIFQGPSKTEVERGEMKKKASVSLPTCSSPPGRLYVQVDGGRVNTSEGWKEPKVGVIFREEERIEINKGHGELLEKEYVGTLEGMETFEKLMWEALLRWGVLEAKEMVLEGDGAEWIWNRIGGELCPGAIEVLDWFHAVEHLWECGGILFEKDEEVKAWVKGMEGLLLESKVEEVCENLGGLKRENERVKGKVEELIGYYEANKERMRYRDYRDRGIYIGSGAVESGVKNVVNNRMKQCGMRWDKERAERMIHLRAEYLSERWPPRKRCLAL